jgi:hypothetical protein
MEPVWRIEGEEGARKREEMRLSPPWCPNAWRYCVSGLITYEARRSGDLVL